MHQLYERNVLEKNTSTYLYLRGMGIGSGEHMLFIIFSIKIHGLQSL